MSWESSQFRFHQILNGFYLRFQGTYRGADIAAKQIASFEEFNQEGGLFIKSYKHPNICPMYGYVSLGPDQQ